MSYDIIHLCHFFLNWSCSLIVATNFKIGHALTLTQGNKLQILDFSSLIKLTNEYFKKLAHYSYSNFYIDKTYKVYIMNTIDCFCVFFKKNFYKVNCLLRCLLGVSCLENKQTTGQFKIIQENNKINLCCSKLCFQEWYEVSVFPLDHAFPDNKQVYSVMHAQPYITYLKTYICLFCWICYDFRHGKLDLWTSNRKAHYMNNSKSHDDYLLSNHPGLVAWAFTSTP